MPSTIQYSLIAGGLNTYGFAGGDPASYVDPFGLCPNQDPDTKLCPGGLQDWEYDQIEADADYLSLSVRLDIVGMLQQGRFIKIPETRSGRPSQSNIGIHGSIGIKDAFFDELSPPDQAWNLAHEYGHIIQWMWGRLIREGNGRPNWARISAMNNAPEGSELNRTIEGDANVFACQNMLVSPIGYLKDCPDGAWGSPSRRGH